LTVFKRIICLFLLVASTMQVTAGAMMPFSKMQSNGQSNAMSAMSTGHAAMTAEQQAHCREMMNNGAMDMDLMMDCVSDCECCSGVCATPLVFIDYQHNILLESLSHSSNSLRVNQPIRITTSLYRPPINA